MNLFESKPEIPAALERRGLKKNMNFYTGLQVRGTPEQCYEITVSVRQLIGCDVFVTISTPPASPARKPKRSCRA